MKIKCLFLVLIPLIMLGAQPFQWTKLVTLPLDTIFGMTATYNTTIVLGKRNQSLITIRSDDNWVTYRTFGDIRQQLNPSRIMPCLQACGSVLFTCGTVYSVSPSQGISFKAYMLMSTNYGLSWATIDSFTESVPNRAIPLSFHVAKTITPNSHIPYVLVSWHDESTHQRTIILDGAFQNPVYQTTYDDIIATNPAGPGFLYHGHRQLGDSIMIYRGYEYDTAWHQLDSIFPVRYQDPYVVKTISLAPSGYFISFLFGTASFSWATASYVRGGNITDQYTGFDQLDLADMIRISPVVSYGNNMFLMLDVFKRAILTLSDNNIPWTRSTTWSSDSLQTYAPFEPIYNADGFFARDSFSVYKLVNKDVSILPIIHHVPIRANNKLSMYDIRGRLIRNGRVAMLKKGNLVLWTK